MSKELFDIIDYMEEKCAYYPMSIPTLLSDRFDAQRAEAVAAALTEGRWTHDYGITFETAQELGLPVDAHMPPEFMQLMALYPQPVRKDPSVEYLPRPRHRSGDPRRGIPSP